MIFFFFFSFPLYTSFIRIIQDPLWIATEFVGTYWQESRIKESWIASAAFFNYHRTSSKQLRNSTRFRSVDNWIPTYQLEKQLFAEFAQLSFNLKAPYQQGKLQRAPFHSFSSFFFSFFFPIWNKLHPTFLAVSFV